MISIRPFEECDAPALAQMMLEMVRSYSAELPDEDHIEADLIEHSERIEFRLGFNGTALAGFATFVTLFPVGSLLSFIYVQQIYVGSSARRLGVAQRLMVEIARTAQSRGCQRMEWATSIDNTAARALYDGLGAIGSTKVQYILEGDALSRIAIG